MRAARFLHRACAALAVVLFAAAVFAIPAAAAGNRVSDITVDVALNADGSARVTQVWTGTFSEGTELYIPFNTNGYLTLTDLTVTGPDGEYTTVSGWNIDASFGQKSGKCGLNRTDSGYEICWGMSSYGSNTYTVSYTVGNMVCAYDDADGFNFRFVNDRMNTVPTDVQLTIRTADGTAINDENCDIWAFGYDGDINFTGSGTILAQTDSALRSDNHVTVMIALNKGVLSPSRTVSGSFEKVKDAAFEGSDYSNDDPFEIVVIVIFAIGAISVLALGVSIIVLKAKFRKFEQNLNYFRDVPNNGDINATYFLAKSFNRGEEGGIIGARLLRMINGGCLEPIATDSVGFAGSTKRRLDLRLVHPPQDGFDDYDMMLYSLMQSAAGEDGILQPNELEKYCAKNYERMRNIVDACGNSGCERLTARGCYSSASYMRLKSLTPTGIDELSQALGYRKYMLDFSLIAEREVTEVYVWQDMMVYAVLYGVADKAAQQLKQVYPQYIPQIEEYEFRANYAYGYCNYMYGAMLRREREIQAARSAGSGGSASFGGGGGFSGGGSGGGSR